MTRCREPLRSRAASTSPTARSAASAKVLQSGHPSGVVAAPQVPPIDELIESPVDAPLGQLREEARAAELGGDVVRPELDSVAPLGLQKQAHDGPIQGSERLDRIGKQRQPATEVGGPMRHGDIRLVQDHSFPEASALRHPWKEIVSSGEGCR
jgi:hypothetical protein